MNDMPESSTIDIRIVRARKDHTCCECGKVIKKDSEYEYYHAIWEGKWDTFRTCLRCGKIRELALSKYPPVYEDEGPAFGELYCWIRECRR